MPRVEELWRKYEAEGFAVLAVESTHDTENALKFIREKELTFAMVEDVEDGESVVSDVLGVYGFPTSYLVDRTGRILYSHAGFDEGDEKRLEEEIRRLLETG